MASNNLEIKVSNDAYEIFMATRVIHCQAIDCKNNSGNKKWGRGRQVECRLKRIFILVGGKCEQYEPKESPYANEED